MTGRLAGAPGRVALVVGTAAGGTGSHVAMLAAGLGERGIAVTVLGPASAGRRFGLAELPGVTFSAAEFGTRPRPGDVAAVLRLRHALAPRRGRAARGAAARGAAAGGAAAGGAAAGGAAAGGAAAGRAGAADRAARGPAVAHAHGLRAGALTAVALAGARRRPALVVTVHNAPPAGPRTAGLVYLVLERIVARRADLVLCVSPDLEERMRARGARRVGRAIVPAPGPPPSPPPRASQAPGAGRPVVLAAGRLAAQKGLQTLLEAAVSWRDLDPAPVVVLAGDGPLAGRLRALAAALGVDAEFPGHVDGVPALLAAADVVVLPSVWEGQPLVLQEALRAGAAIVASRVGGIPALTGEDAALLVPPGDAGQLADAVRAVLTGPALAGRLRAAARRRAAALPAEADAVAAALACYAAARRLSGPAAERPGG